MKFKRAGWAELQSKAKQWLDEGDLEELTIV
jgi:hypothetical protein